MNTVLLLHAACTWFMVGLIWFVQVVHYPLFARVGQEHFPTYEAEHARRTTLVVLAPMLGELMTSMWLWRQAPGFLTTTGAILVLGLWLSTLLVQSPIHGRLTQGFDLRLWQNLVSSNRWRTLVWTLRGGLALLLLS